MLADLLVRQAPGQQPEDFDLTAGQAGRPSLLAQALDIESRARQFYADPAANTDLLRRWSIDYVLARPDQAKRLMQLPELRLRALESYAAATLGLGGTELTAAVRTGRQLTRLAPLRESGYRYLMRALAAQDNLAEALGVYGQLSECLREQLGVSPSPATRALYEELLAAT